MFSSSFQGRQMLPPHLFDPFKGAYIQVLFSVLLAMAVYSLLFVALPQVIPFVVTTYYTFLHEASHSLVSAMGGGSWPVFQVNSDGSGVAHVLSASDEHGVLVLAAGLVLPAWFGAAILTFGIVRVGVDLSLWVLGITTGLLTLLCLKEPNSAVVVSLYSVAILACVAAYLPANGLVKSACALVFAFLIGHGVYSSAGYAYVGWIDDAETKASDALKIAMAFGDDHVGDVGNVLVGSMIAGYCIALVVAFSWLERHG